MTIWKHAHNTQIEEGIIYTHAPTPIPSSLFFSLCRVKKIHS